MIYAMRSTKEGQEMLSCYDGSSDRINFIEAVILTKVCADDGITLFSNLYSALVNDYPLPIGKDYNLAAKIRSLKSRGLLEIVDDIGVNTITRFKTSNGYVFTTSLGNFFTLNDIQVKFKNHIINELRYKGRVSYDGLRITL